MLPVEKIKNSAKEVTCLYSILFQANNSLGAIQGNLQEELLEIRDKLEKLYQQSLKKLEYLVDVLDDELE